MRITELKTGVLFRLLDCVVIKESTKEIDLRRLFGNGYLGKDVEQEFELTIC